MIDLGEFRRVRPDGLLDGVYVTDAQRDPDCPRFFHIGDAQYVHATCWAGFLTDKITRAQPGDRDVAAFIDSRAMLRRLAASLSPLSPEPSTPASGEPAIIKGRRRARTPEPATA